LFWGSGKKTKRGEKENNKRQKQRLNEGKSGGAYQGNRTRREVGGKHREVTGSRSNQKRCLTRGIEGKRDKGSLTKS